MATVRLVVSVAREWWAGDSRAARPVPELRRAASHPRVRILRSVPRHTSPVGSEHRARQDEQVRLEVLGVPVPRNPKVVDPPAARLPLYDTLRTVTVDPDAVETPFQRELTDVPGRVTVQDAIADLPAVTVPPW